MHEIFIAFDNFYDVLLLSVDFIMSRNYILNTVCSGL